MKLIVATSGASGVNLGLKTLKQCKTAGPKGIVLKSKQNVFLERKKCINFANKNKMFLIAK